jgi:hypothetical protein
VFCFLLISAASHAAMLVENNKSDYIIVLAPEASPSEETAAEELQTYFEACTGVRLAIVRDTPDTAPMIVLGAGPAAEALGVTPDAAELGEQGYVMKTVGDNVVIAGSRAAGTLYGVHAFLEEHLGVRWYAPEAIRTPKVDSLELPALDTLVKPAFAWRHTSYGWNSADEAFRVRQGDNNGGGDAAHPWGTQHSHDGRCHSYFNFISPGEYFDTHPEYFSEIGGVRREHETQLCLTNPEVLEIVTEKMLARMAERPNDRQHNFSQQDYYNHCQCADCAAINEKYGSLGGTQYWFVNELAARTSKVYPDKLIGTLAYMYTEEPPKDLEMHPNVAVWLCHMFPSCDSHPIATCPLNADFKRRAERWSEICKHLYIWHYIVDFAHYYNPFPNFRAMAADMRFYRDIGAEGIYLQGMGPNGGEFGLLRPYLGMHLLRDPDLDADALIRDFLQGYYGAASEPIHQYLTLLHDKVQNEDIHMHLYTNPAQGYLTDEVVAQSETLFDQAEAAVAEDAELLERVKVARMPLVYARLFPRNGYEIKNGALWFSGEHASLAEIAEFLERMKRHGFDTIREREGDPAQLPMLAMAMHTPMPVNTIENEHLRVDVVPFLGGRALRIIDKASGTCITGHNVTKNLFFPFQGGEETRRGGNYDISGMFDLYSVAASDARSVTLTTEAGGFRFTRALSLSEDAPLLTVRVTAENTSDTPRDLTLRSHTELDLGPLGSTKAHFVNREGEQVEPEMKNIIAGLREGEYYLDQHAPRGEWTLSGEKGLTITQRFDDAILDFAWLYAYPEALGVLDAELWRKPETVAPGASIMLEHEMEVRTK